MTDTSQSLIERASGATPNLELSVRELISYWGAKGRGTQIVALVREALADAHLTTVPDFRDVSLDSVVQLVPYSRQPVEAETTPADRDPDADEERDYMLTVGTLPTAVTDLTAVRPETSLLEAYTQMRLRDYSQLPVLVGRRSLKGVVTWQSIAHALLAGADDRTVEVARVQHEPVQRSDDLLKVLPRITESNFVLVKNETNEICGIVTSSDINVLFRSKTRAFLLVGEVEQRLRDVLRRRLDEHEILTLCAQPGGRSLQSSTKMSMGDCQAIISRPEIWDRLGWRLDRGAFCKTLDEVREVRNEVMHFTDEITDDRIEQVQHFVQVLRDILRPE